MKDRYECYFIKGNKEDYWLNYRIEGERGWKDKDSTTGSLLYKEFPECLQLTDDFNKHQGAYPEGETPRWECLQKLRERVRKVADKYAGYNKVIIVCHGMVIRTLTYAEEINPAEIIECEYLVGQPDCIYSFA